MNLVDPKKEQESLSTKSKVLQGSSSRNLFDLIVIGGGPAGFMGAITAAEQGINLIAILESTSKTLEKVRISGGGRCNITNACWEPKDLVVHYPRGEKALLGAFSRFATGDAIDWFEGKGLKLIIEEDGRIFPKSNSSQEVVNCLKVAAAKAGIKYSTQMDVVKVDYLGGKKGFKIICRNKKFFYSKRILLSTGGNPSGKKIASNLGHKTIKSVPSLFTFKISEQWLKDCAGVSIDNIRMSLKTSHKTFDQSGRILITHWGLSGPAILKLSAFAARELYNQQYKANLTINWSGFDTIKTKDLLIKYREDFANKSLKKIHPFKNLPKRVWLSILKMVNIDYDTRWSSLSKSNQVMLSEALSNDVHCIFSKGPFGEEFVTAGGIDLREIEFKSMESRIQKGLYFAGEIINIDGITGGFNFQHCWSSGWLAGQAVANSLDFAV